MKPMVSKTTESYLKQLEEKESKGIPSQPYQAYPDAVDQLIAREKLQIQKVFFDLDLDLMVIVLNNTKILKESIGSYKRLKNASLKQLQSYKLSPMGVHWPVLNEDLSLKGLLESALYLTVHQQTTIS